MIVYRCDVCGTKMPANDPQRYILKIEAFAAAGPVEFSQEELAKDHGQEIRQILDTLSQQSQDQIEDSVYRALRYDLCAACHGRFLGQGQPGLQGLGARLTTLQGEQRHRARQGERPTPHWPRWIPQGISAPLFRLLAERCLLLFENQSRLSKTTIQMIFSCQISVSRLG